MQEKVYQVLDKWLAIKDKQAIDIICNGLPSLYRRLPPERIFVEFVADAMEKAAQCTECGECEERCPYRLPIQEMIEPYVAEYRDILHIRNRTQIRLS